MLGVELAVLRAVPGVIMAAPYPAKGWNVAKLKEGKFTMSKKHPEDDEYPSPMYIATHHSLIVHVVVDNVDYDLYMCNCMLCVHGLCTFLMEA